MELHLQFGYGMMDHCRHLIDRWGGGTVILSPRDMLPDQLSSFPPKITALSGGRLLLDPQFYLPHSNHERLRSHGYWPQDYDTGVFWQGEQLRDLLNRLLELNDRIGSAEFILPGLLATEVDDDWVQCQSSFLEGARALGIPLPLRATIALSAEAVQSQEQVERLLEAAESWRAPAYYVVCQHPKGQYLVDDPNWLANVLDIVAGLKLGGANVVLGYSNHQMLVAGAAKVDAIASGTWMNVRSFPPDKFSAAYNEDPRTRSTWYYCPQALSEYTLPFLTVAQRVGALPQMAPPPHLDGGYTAALFGGAPPNTAGFNDQPAFRHYLHALHEQVAIVVADTYDDTVSRLEELLDTSATTLAALRQNGVNGQQRDFTQFVDVGRGALALFGHLRGAVLRRRWADI